jgi:adenylosuccinate synthase
LRLLNDPNAAREFATLFAATSRRFSSVDSSATVLAAEGDIVFEGAQGVLLDEWHGFHPYTTWSTTTFANAQTLLAEHRYAGDIRRIGIARAYMTRHGAGPFPTESLRLTEKLREAHNGTNDWQHGFRFGWPDLVLLRYALRATGGIDELALTCLDQLPALPLWKVARTYADIGELKIAPPPNLEHQERLTSILEDARPVYENLPAADLGDYLRDALHCRPGINSFGTTWQQKHLPGKCLRDTGRPSARQPLPQTV